MIVEVIILEVIGEEGKKKAIQKDMSQKIIIIINQIKDFTQRIITKVKIKVEIETNTIIISIDLIIKNSTNKKFLKAEILIMKQIIILILNRMKGSLRVVEIFPMVEIIIHLNLFIKIEIKIIKIMIHKNENRNKGWK